MYRITLDEATRQHLRERCHAPDLKPRTRDRLEMVLLSATGWSVRRIAEHMHVCRATVRTWLRAYRQEGVDALPDKPHPGPPSALTPLILHAVREHVHQSERTWTGAQLAAWIAEQHGVVVSASWLREKLRHTRLSYKRTSRHLKHKQNPEQIATKQTEKAAYEKRGTRANWT